MSVLVAPVNKSNVLNQYLEQHTIFPSEHLCWYVTERCNYTCRFCYRYQDGEEGLDFVQAQRLLDNLKNLGISKITFTGEPLLVGWIYDAIQYAHSLGMYTTMMTNGSLFKPEKEQHLKQYLRRISLPLDGSDESMNLTMSRAPGHFKRVKELANLFKNSSVSLKISTVITRINRQDIGSIADRVIELGAQEWKTYQFRANRGFAIESAEDFAISNNDFSESISIATKHIASSSIKFSSVSLTDRFTDFFLVRPNGEMELATGKGYVKLGNLRTDKADNLMNVYNQYLRLRG